MRSILIIDDDQSILKNLSYALKTKKINALTADTGKKGLELAKKELPEAIFLDFSLPDTDGLKLIPKLLEINPLSIIIMITGTASLDIAVKAIKAGAYDFVEKPFDIDKIFAVLNKAEKEKIKKEKLILLEEQVRKTQDLFVGVSPAVREIKELVRKVVKNPNFTILISGESGTGKEVLVRYIHESSICKDRSLVDINCSAIPEQLLESELFGYEKGAFTDARETKRGLFEVANNGIIFLDEIGDMRMDLQTKLLRVLENKTIRRIGGEENIALNISVIAATNKNIMNMIQEKKFREDLYYRLNIIPVHLPPLRERKEDLEPLIDYFIEKQNLSFRKTVKGIKPDALVMLKKYSFPGNIRELKNILERAMLLESTNYLTADNFTYLKTMDSKTKENDPEAELNYDYQKYQEKVLNRVEKNYFEKLLKKYNGSVSKAAEHAGIMVPSLSRILKRLDIEKSDFK